MVTIGVTAAGGGIGQSVLHALSRSTRAFRIVAMDANPTSAGLYWSDRSFLVPRAAEENAYIEELLAICRQERLDILVPGLDIELPVLSRHSERFHETGCRVLVSSPSLIGMCRDKYELAAFCRKKGLPFVRTFLLEEARDEAEKLDYPVIIKPRSGSASAGAHLVHSPERLRAIPSDDNLIVQDYLPPRRAGRGDTLPGKTSTGGLDQSNELSIQFYVNRSGRILGGFASINLLKNGIPVEIDPVPGHPALSESLPMVEALVEQGLYGPVNLQGRETAKGVRFFEINPRFTGITGLRAAFGYREMEAAVADLLLEPEENAVGLLDYVPGNFGLRYVADALVPRERMQKVSRVKVVDSPRPHDGPPAPVKKILITGATGYFGANIAEQLLAHPETTEVQALVRNGSGREKLNDALGSPAKLAFRNGELPCGMLDLGGVDTVVHAASERLSSDPSRLFLINAEGTRTLLEAMHGAGVKRLVYISSQSVYGTGMPPLWREEMGAAPETPYASSKWMGELFSLNGQYRIAQVVVLRVARLYGLGHFLRWEELPHKFAALAAEGKPLTVFREDNEIDLVHVRDAASAVVAACTTEFPEGCRTVFNIGGGSPLTIKHFAAISREAARNCGLQEPSLDLQDSGEGHLPRRWGMDIRKAQSELEWSPRHALLPSMEDLVRSRIPNAVRSDF